MQIGYPASLACILHLEYDSTNSSLRAAVDTMAFEQPLESDRVDHSSLFSTLLRNPIAGVFMWVLGEHSKDRDDEPEEELTSRSTNDEDACEGDRPQIKRVSSHLPISMKSTPSMVGSELSDIGESAEEALGGGSLRLHGSHQSLALKLSRKHLSWSDDAGKNLVQFQNQVSLLRRDVDRFCRCFGMSMVKTNLCRGCLCFIRVVLKLPARHPCFVSWQRTRTKIHPCPGLEPRMSNQ